MFRDDFSVALPHVVDQVYNALDFLLRALAVFGVRGCHLVGTEGDVMPAFLPGQCVGGRI